MNWTTAGANFEPHIREVCTEVDGYASFDACAVKVRELFLAADLKLWNALDAKNLTWEQRPARSMPAHLVDHFTFGGKIQHLQWYRSDSGSPHPPYSSGEIDVLIDRARSRVPGSAYPHVDASLFSCKRSTMQISTKQLGANTDLPQWPTPVSSMLCWGHEWLCLAQANHGMRALSSRWVLHTSQRSSICHCILTTTRRAFASKHFMLTTRRCETCRELLMLP